MEIILDIIDVTFEGNGVGKKDSVAVFVPETCGKGQDWVLILDGGKRDWKEIGQMVH